MAQTLLWQSFHSFYMTCVSGKFLSARTLFISFQELNLFTSVLIINIFFTFCHHISKCNYMKNKQNTNLQLFHAKIAQHDNKEVDVQSLFIRYTDNANKIFRLTFYAQQKVPLNHSTRCTLHITIIFTFRIHTNFRYSANRLRSFSPPNYFCCENIGTTKVKHLIEYCVVHGNVNISVNFIGYILAHTYPASCST